MKSLVALTGGCEFVGRAVGGLQLHPRPQTPLSQVMEQGGGGVGQAAGCPALLSGAQIACRDTGRTAMEQCHVQRTLLNSSLHLHSAQISVFTIRFGSIYFLK